MSLLLIIVLLLLCGWLWWRLRAVRRTVGRLLEAAAGAQPVLPEAGGAGLRAAGMDRLVLAFNDLLAERARMSGAGKGYHDQVQALLGNLREAVVMVDEANTVLSANPAFAELAGPGTLPGRRLDTLLQGAGFLQLLREVREGRRGARQEIEVQGAGGTIWLEASAAALEAGPDGGGGRYTLFVFHNITRQKQLEKMRTEFVANVSHELRTPVTVIKGFADTLVDDDDLLSPEEKRRFLEKIRNNAARLHGLLQDLLLLSRLESTEVVLQKESFQLCGFLRELADNWRPAAGDPARQLLVLELDEACGTIHADPLRLSQVITNLLDNAVRHARGCTEIRLRAQPDPAGVLLAVTDNGCGIPAADLPHIFQRFYRVEKGRSREAGGTGLGLAIVKHIVVQHGGTISARSEKGQGTEITVRLPAGKPR